MRHTGSSGFPRIASPAPSRSVIGGTADARSSMSASHVRPRNAMARGARATYASSPSTNGASAHGRAADPVPPPSSPPPPPPPPPASRPPPRPPPTTPPPGAWHSAIGGRHTSKQEAPPTLTGRAPAPARFEYDAAAYAESAEFAPRQLSSSALSQLRAWGAVFYDTARRGDCFWLSALHWSTHCTHNYVETITDLHLPDSFKMRLLDFVLAHAQGHYGPELQQQTLQGCELARATDPGMDRFCRENGGDIAAIAYAREKGTYVPDFVVERLPAFCGKRVVIFAEDANGKLVPVHGFEPETQDYSNAFADALVLIHYHIGKHPITHEWTMHYGFTLPHGQPAPLTRVTLATPPTGPSPAARSDPAAAKPPVPASGTNVPASEGDDATASAAPLDTSKADAEDGVRHCAEVRAASDARESAELATATALSEAAAATPSASGATEGPAKRAAEPAPTGETLITEVAGSNAAHRVESLRRAFRRHGDKQGAKAAEPIEASRFEAPTQVAAQLRPPILRLHASAGPPLEAPFSSPTPDWRPQRPSKPQQQQRRESVRPVLATFACPLHGAPKTSGRSRRGRASEPCSSGPFSNEFARDQHIVDCHDGSKAAVQARANLLKLAATTGKPTGSTTVRKVPTPPPLRPPSPPPPREQVQLQQHQEPLVAPATLPAAAPRAANVSDADNDGEVLDDGVLLDDAPAPDSALNPRPPPGCSVLELQAWLRRTRERVEEQMGLTQPGAATPGPTPSPPRGGASSRSGASLRDASSRRGPPPPSSRPRRNVPRVNYAGADTDEGDDDKEDASLSSSTNGDDSDAGSDNAARLAERLGPGRGNTPAPTASLASTSSAPYGRRRSKVLAALAGTVDKMDTSNASSRWPEACITCVLCGFKALQPLMPKHLTNVHKHAASLVLRDNVPFLVTHGISACPCGTFTSGGPGCFKRHARSCKQAGGALVTAAVKAAHPIKCTACSLTFPTPGYFNDHPCASGQLRSNRGDRVLVPNVAAARAAAAAATTAAILGNESSRRQPAAPRVARALAAAAAAAAAARSDSDIDATPRPPVKGDKDDVLTSFSLTFDANFVTPPRPRGANIAPPAPQATIPAAQQHAVTPLATTQPRPPSSAAKLPGLPPLLPKGQDEALPATLDKETRAARSPGLSPPRNPPPPPPPLEPPSRPPAPPTGPSGPSAPRGGFPPPPPPPPTPGPSADFAETSGLLEARRRFDSFTAYNAYATELLVAIGRLDRTDFDSEDAYLKQLSNMALEYMVESPIFTVKALLEARARPRPPGNAFRSTTPDPVDGEHFVTADDEDFAERLDKATAGEELPGLADRRPDIQIMENIGAAAKKLANGELAKACSRLDSNGLANLDDPKVEALLRQLYPQRHATTLCPTETAEQQCAFARNHPPRTTLGLCSSEEGGELGDMQKVLAVLKKKKKNTAGGMQGLTPDNIKGTLKYASSHGHKFGFVRGLIVIFNFLNAGIIPSDTLLGVVRTLIGVALIKEPGNPKPRPVGIGETLVTLAASCLEIDKVAYEKETGRTQLGCFIDGGSETLAHFARTYLALNPTHVLAKLDVANAFNTVRNDRVLLMSHKAGIPAHAHMRYGGTNKVVYRTSSGKAIIIKTTEGVIQGDTHGSTLYNMAQGSAVLATMKEHPGLTIANLHDDAFAAGEASTVFGALPAYAKNLKDTNNSDLQLPKCAVLCPDDKQAHEVGQRAKALGMTIVDGVMIAGIPIGTPKFVDETLGATVASALRTAALAARVNLETILKAEGYEQQQLFELFRLCISTKITHLLRSAPPDTTKRWAAAFKSGFADAVLDAYALLGDAAKKGTTARHLAVQRLTLPFSFGGAGATDTELAVEPQYFGSLVLVWPRLMELLGARSEADWPRLANSVAGLDECLAFVAQSGAFPHLDLRADLFRLGTAAAADTPAMLTHRPCDALAPRPMPLPTRSPLPLPTSPGPASPTTSFRPQQPPHDAPGSPPAREPAKSRTPTGGARAGLLFDVGLMLSALKRQASEHARTGIPVDSAAHLQVIERLNALALDDDGVSARTSIADLLLYHEKCVATLSKQPSEHTDAAAPAATSDGLLGNDEAQQAAGKAWATRPLPDIMAAAEGGDPTAQYRLGINFRDGAGGVLPDNSQYLAWIRRAAKAKMAAAQTELGFIYDKGLCGLPVDLIKGAHLHALGAAQGNPLAQLNLGCSLRDGEGVPADPQLAAQLIRHNSEPRDQDLAEHLIQHVKELLMRFRAAAPSPAGPADNPEPEPGRGDVDDASEDAAAGRATNNPIICVPPETARLLRLEREPTSNSSSEDEGIAEDARWRELGRGDPRPDDGKRFANDEGDEDADPSVGRVVRFDVVTTHASATNTGPLLDTLKALAERLSSACVSLVGKGKLLRSLVFQVQNPAPPNSIFLLCGAVAFNPIHLSGWKNVIGALIRTKGLETLLLPTIRFESASKIATNIFWGREERLLGTDGASISSTIGDATVWTLPQLPQSPSSPATVAALLARGPRAEAIRFEATCRASHLEAEAAASAATPHRDAAAADAPAERSSLPPLPPCTCVADASLSACLIHTTAGATANAGAGQGQGEPEHPGPPWPPDPPDTPPDPDSRPSGDFMVNGRKFKIQLGASKAAAAATKVLNLSKQAALGRAMTRSERASFLAHSHPIAHAHQTAPHFLLRRYGAALNNDLFPFHLATLIGLPVTAKSHLCNCNATNLQKGLGNPHEVGRRIEPSEALQHAMGHKSCFGKRHTALKNISMGFFSQALGADNVVFEKKPEGSEAAGYQTSMNRYPLFIPKGGPGSTELKADGIVTLGNKLYALDFVISHPAPGIAGLGTTVGVTAARAAEHKRRHYEAHYEYPPGAVVPMSFETNGLPDTEAVAFIDKVFRFATQRNPGSDFSELRRGLFISISAAIARHVATAQRYVYNVCSRPSSTAGAA